MVAPQTVFPGDQDETLLIVNAVARNCACTYALTGAQTSMCGAHEMLVSDQRALNGLVWMRRDVTRLRREEFTK